MTKRIQTRTCSLNQIRPRSHSVRFRSTCNKSILEFHQRVAVWISAAFAASIKRDTTRLVEIKHTTCLFASFASRLSCMEWQRVRSIAIARVHSAASCESGSCAATRSCMRCDYVTATEWVCNVPRGVVSGNARAAPDSSVFSTCTFRIPGAADNACLSGSSRRLAKQAMKRATQGGLKDCAMWRKEVWRIVRCEERKYMVRR